MAHYYRADLTNYVDSAYPKIVKIKTTRELKDYYDNNRAIYQFHIGYYSEASMADDVFSELSVYNDGFFEHKLLLFIILQEGSGSVRHRVESVVSTNGALSVNIARIVPEIGTADMAQWHIALELDKTLSDKEIDVLFF